MVRLHTDPIRIRIRIRNTAGAQINFGDLTPYFTYAVEYRGAFAIDVFTGRNVTVGAIGAFFSHKCFHTVKDSLE
jgi:hypothetical protein